MSSVAIEETRRLVNRILGGDQEAVIQLVNQYKQRVFALCYRMLGQREEAEDVSQESFLRVFRNLTSWDQTRAFEPWLLTITANRCRTQLAKRKRQSFELSEPPVDRSWQHHNDAKHLWEEVKLVLATLPVKHRQAFELFHEKHRSYAEIARELEVPEGTIKTWVHRARSSMIQKLADREVVEVRRAM